MASLRYPLTRRLPEPNPSGLFFAVTVVYVLVLALAAASGSGLLKALAHGTAVAGFALLAVHWLFLPRTAGAPPGVVPALGLYYAGLGAALIVGLQAHDLVDLLKLVLAPAFVVFGADFERQRPRWQMDERQRPRWQMDEHQRPRWLSDELPVRLGFAALVLLPLGAWAAQLAAGHTALGGGREVGLFANRNNAALYAVTLIALHAVLSGRPLQRVAVYLLVGAAFGTLGVLLAVLLALVLAVGRPRTLVALLAALALFALVAWLLPEVGVFARLGPLRDSLRLLADGRVDLATVSYADLVRQLRSTDLSFLFRLKHWLELITLYAQGSPYEWLFGFGIGASVRLSEIHLVPHNDYLRLLFECGALTLLGFVALLGVLLWHVGRRWEGVPLAVVAIYFASENLVNNYLAMSVFWFSAGALAARSRSTTHAPR
ncbi:MAG: hypothetical protein KIT35_28385 [Piscinibacter sp.]|uniref:hypothetical protein n=1 Tax=Piscinibacter sp. TaxID=1903157 RepID=UPI00258931D4|nr:hypothetical protein [Piscinibacter sp.]MCW5667773.1 hypothetical protein [Piscinibacter sp.]